MIWKDNILFIKLQPNRIWHDLEREYFVHKDLTIYAMIWKDNILFVN